MLKILIVLLFLPVVCFAEDNLTIDADELDMNVKQKMAIFKGNVNIILNNRYLYDNQLTGCIPEWIGSLVELTDL